MVVFERDKDAQFRRQGFNLVLSDKTAKILSDECGFPDHRTKYDYVCDMDPLGIMPISARVDGSALLKSFLRGFGAVRRGGFRDTLLEQAMHAGVRIEYNHKLAAITDPSDVSQPVEMSFAGGQAASARVLVGCDGINSNTRELISSRQLSGCGALCIRGAADDDGTMHAAAGVPAGAPMLLFVSCCPGTGFNCTVFGGRVTWVLELRHPEPGALGRHGNEQVRAVMADRIRGWGSAVQKLLLEITPLEALHVEPLYDLGDLDGSSGSGRVTVIGDAAHPVTWTGGGNLAIEDGAALARVLADQGLTVEALRAHERSMSERNPVANTKKSRKQLPSYAPLQKVLWWYCWSAMRPAAYLMSTYFPVRSVREVCFGLFQLLRSRL